MSKVLRAIRAVVASWYVRSPFFSEKRYFRFPARIMEREMQEKMDFKVLHIGGKKKYPAALWEEICVRHMNGEVAMVREWSGVDVLFKKGAADFIYIDGRHSYSATKEDLVNAEAFLKEGGVIAGDDLELLAGQVDRTAMEVSREEDLIVDPKTGVAYHPGVTLALQEFFGSAITKERAFWAVRRRAGNWEPIINL